MNVTYTIYERRDGPGPAFLCRPLVNGQERLIFSGSSAEQAEATARTWIEKNCTPPKPRKTREAVSDLTDDEDIFA